VMKKILLAYDGGDPARHALDTAAELAIKFGASLSVVSVVPLRTGRAATDPWDDSTVHAQELVEAKHLLQEKGIEADLMEPAGDPARTIEHIAEEGGFDTIVMGSRGMGAMGRALQGSVSEHVATHSDRTVIITH
jgi:nucleotide-binding universal stress UspA family protein